MAGSGQVHSLVAALRIADSETLFRLLHVQNAILHLLAVVRLLLLTVALCDVMMLSYGSNYRVP